ncbi:hypothetical protein CYJ19_05685 [Winkia neuii]|uniref:Uncharacterized protein n=1 Tax=Winkia neuii TaxID=33007 RepID=A0A2I1IMH6_9ACTO|nr:hypothetical protein CYJ19_05685 [Winkia neuii]
MTVHYLSRKQFAERIGVAVGTLSRYKLPAPDVIVGPPSRPVQGWTEKTIDEWNAERPRRRQKSAL